MSQGTSTGSSRSGSGATERLSRLLALVPYLVQHQGVPLGDAARQFGISEVELVKDLELLFVCGTPGHLPDDLIEAEWESGQVYLANAETIARPLRLGIDEAVALLVGLRTLAAVPGLHDREALDGATAKLSAATGELAAAASAVDVQLETTEPQEVAAACQQALAGRRRLHLRYLVPSRDETTERDVDPMRALSVDGRMYLEAWCHQAEGVRLFRLDRMVSAKVLDQDGTPPPQAVSRDLDAGLFSTSPQDLLITIDLAPPARWVAEYYPTETVQEEPGGRLRVQLRTADARWLRRLLLRLGDGARVIDPPELARDAADAAREALRNYEP